MKKFIITDGEKKYTFFASADMAQRITYDQAYVADLLQSVLGVIPNHQVSITEDTSVEPSQNSPVEQAVSDTEKFHWTHSGTLLLISLYKTHRGEFDDPHKLKKDVWSNIAQEMQSMGYTVDSETCDKKWRNMKCTYRRILEERRLPGYHKKTWKTWEYFETFQELYGEDFKSQQPSSSNSPSTKVVQVTTPLAGIVQTTPVIDATVMSPMLGANCSSASNPTTLVSADGFSVTINPSRGMEADAATVVDHLQAWRNGGISAAESSMQVQQQLNGPPGKRLKKGRGGGDPPPRWFKDYMKYQREAEERRIAETREMHRQTLEAMRENNEILRELSMAVRVCLQSLVPVQTSHTIEHMEHKDSDENQP